MKRCFIACLIDNDIAARPAPGRAAWSAIRERLRRTKARIPLSNPILRRRPNDGGIDRYLAALARQGENAERDHFPFRLMQALRVDEDDGGRSPALQFCAE